MIPNLSHWYSFWLYLSKHFSLLQDINIPIVPLSKSTFIMTPLWVSVLSISISNYTSFNILKVLRTFLWQLFSFAMLSRSLVHMPLGYAFSSIGHTAFPFSFFVYPSHFFNSSHSFSLTTLYPLSSATWCPFFPQSSHIKYETTTSPLLYSSLNKFTSLGTPSSQYLNALCYRTFSELLFHSSCYVFCGITTCTALSLSNLLFGQSLH